MKNQVDLSAIWLRREGPHAIVLVERDGVWHEAIREFADSPFSHIIESTGILRICLPDPPEEA